MEKSKELPLDTVLNPELRLSTDFHFWQAFFDETVNAGDSIAEHTAIEQANEYLAEKAIEQTFFNG
ncbi:hypothetical protein [Anoxybacteroides amylolyticum]|uniref:Uncharacterized protein n=1 Tax=Anoxybacteroides amylolyticum TaxID=294699 RepID=A0A160F425_9BACL|nr:hypothetical protein [Anoxybacillus amylolyticus]ANB61149.1 hypothetical protein GFC30_1052 [Anoxybacillus amylolyticus]